MDRFGSLLFVPGIRPAMFDKAKAVPADIICLDLEDSVALADKAQARENVAGAIASMAAGVNALYVRVNAHDTGFLEEDLNAIVQPGLRGISLPKANDPLDLVRADHYLTLLEQLRGIEPGSIRIISYIESAKAISNCEAIVSASPRAVAASFGAEDFTNDLGIPRVRNSPAIEAARARMALACRAVGVVPVDTPEPDYKDLEWLEVDSRASRDLGFEGRFCIHPSQVEIVNRSYRPTEKEIAKAEQIVQVYEDAISRGLGAIGLDGAMIDQPVVERARRLLQRAR